MNAMYDIDIAIPSISPFVCPWHSGIVSQRLNVVEIISPQDSPISFRTIGLIAVTKSDGGRP